MYFIAVNPTIASIMNTTSSASTMRAITLSQYGSPETLQLKEISRPVPQGREILVKVHVAAINDYDWNMVLGRPVLYRLLFGLFKPRMAIPGMELSGKVVALGSEASLFKEGDAVYGDISDYGFGAFAEYISIDERALIRKPDGLSFADAAALSHASMLAWQALIDVGRIRNGQKILINGAGGGVGTFGLQIAKRYEVEVTGVDTGPKLDMMKALGFDHVVDYRQQDFTKNGQQYDLIIDAKTNRSPFVYAGSLRTNGAYVTVGGTPARLIQILLSRSWISRFQKKRMRIVALKPNKDLEQVHRLYEDQRIKCIIDGPFSLEEVPRALAYFGAGEHSGKVIVVIFSE